MSRQHQTTLFATPRPRISRARQKSEILSSCALSKLTLSQHRQHRIIVTTRTQKNPKLHMTLFMLAQPAGQYSPDVISQYSLPHSFAFLPI